MDRPGRTYSALEARDAGGRLTGWLTAHVFDGPEERVGDILDLCAEPEAAEALWGAALAHFRKGAATTVSAWALKETPLFARFTSWGLAPRGPRTHFAGRWDASSEQAPFPVHGRDWRISKGDSDVF
jgi:hypothetical protein